MAENESEQNTPAQEIPDEVIDSWSDLMARTAETFTFTIESPIRDMMEELARISNMCFAHYIRLWAYQNALEALPEPVPEKSPMPPMTKGMPST